MEMYEQDVVGVLGIVPGGKCLDAPIAVSTRCTTTYSELRTRIYASLLPHQQEFVNDTDHLLLGLCAGFGAGKTYALTAKCIFLAMDNPHKVGAVFEPTYQMVLDVWVRSFDEFLEKFAIEYDYRASPQPEYILHLPHGPCTLLCRTLEKTSRLRGTNLAFALADEIDTSKFEIAQKACEMILARLRGGPRPQFALASTPEGYGFMWNTFDQKAAPDRHLIRARTLDNPYLPAGFIDSLYANYPPQLLSAYLQGQFTALDKTTVYSYFDRDIHWSDEEVKPEDAMYVGLDFNVGTCFIEVCVRRGDVFHFVDEYHVKDTPTIALRLQELYPTHIERNLLTVVPDAASKNRTTTNASESDLAILKRQGLRIKIQSQNPLVEDRVNAVQVLLLNNRLRIHPRCTYLIRAFETQTYNSKGTPDKSGTGLDDKSGPVDAAGYVLHSLAGLRRYATGASNFEFK